MSFSFSWDLPGLNQDRFQAYSSLLRLRNGGQVDNRFEAEHELESKGSLVAYEDADSVVAQPISSFDDTKLKESFQDRVAELVSNVKGGYHVAATLLLNFPEGVKLVVAKKEGFNKADKEFLGKLQNFLREVSRTPSKKPDERLQAALICKDLHGDDQRPAFWNEMLTYSDTRLRDWVIEFQRVAKTFADSCPGNSLDAVNSRTLHSDILDLLERSFKDSKSTLVVTAHAIWNSYGQQDFISACNNRSEMARTLRLSIGFLSRLDIGFNVMVRAAERLNNFQELTIYPLVSWPSKKLKRIKGNGRSTSWTLSQTFQSLSKPLDSTNVKLLFGQKWTKHKLIAEFDKIQTQSPQIHAEVQLVLYAAQQSLEGGVHSEYIGCSKRSCFLCWEFLKAHGAFRTRASHGRIYNLWTVPETENLPEKRLGTLTSALKSVEEVLKNLLCDKRQEMPWPAKESTVGGSSIATRMPLHSSPHTTNLILRYLVHQRQAEQDRGMEEP